MDALWHKIIAYEKWLQNNYFQQITNLTRNSLNMSFFPRDFEGANSLKTYLKIIFLGEVFGNDVVSEGVSVWCLVTVQCVSRDAPQKQARQSFAILLLAVSCNAARPLLIEKVPKYTST